MSVVVSVNTKAAAAAEPAPTVAAQNHLMLVD
jgi:hypothetical protein